MQQVLDIYPAGNGFIGQIRLNKDTISQLKNSESQFGNSTDCNTIVIMDISSSMGNNVKRIITKILPEALINAGYGPSDVIELITFDSVVEHHTLTVSGMQRSNIRCRGATQMTGAIRKLSEIFLKNNGENTRIVTISDGDLHDQASTIETSNRLAKIIEGKYNISSKAIRFMSSSYGQPDTRGLSSVLQFNTHGSTPLIDVDYHLKDSQIIEEFQKLFTDDFGNCVYLESNDNIFRKTPWEEASSRILLSEGETTFWLASQPDILKIGENYVVAQLRDGVDYNSFSTILKTKIDYFLKKLKVLKVIGTEESNQEIQKIIAYFKQMETSLAKSEGDAIDLLKDGTLKARLSFFRGLAQKKSKSISIKMSEIANDDKVSLLNSAQQAAYLRSASDSSNAKSLAKRAIKSGLDFDDIARNEVRQMKQHLSQLNGIDDSDHYVSFYSQETTLGGIKAVCALVDDEGTLDSMSALDILNLINIVGIPTKAPVGDFPDPMTYRCNKLLLGTFVSISDVMMVRDGGNVLKNPYGDNEEINNVVPVYDDDRIHHFLIKHAPTLLEYVGSIGMRNMLLHIPQTYMYIICDGAWNANIKLRDNKTQANIEVIQKLIKTFAIAVRGTFDNVNTQDIKEQSREDKDKGLAFWIGNNGITNMISPMINIFTRYPEQKKFLPEILRTLYGFEFYQGLRKLFLGEDAYIKKAELLRELLGFNPEKYGAKIPAHFECAQSPKHYKTMHLNEEVYERLNKRVWHIDYLTSFPKYIESTYNPEYDIDSINLSEESIVQALGITTDLKTFKYFCMVQALMFDTKAARVDDEKRKHHVLDCGNVPKVTELIENYLHKHYKAHYDAELSKKGKEEHKILNDELVDSMVNAPNIEEFCRLFRDGLTRGHVKEVISDSYKLGFVELRDKLFDPQVNVPVRGQKLWVFIIGSTPSDELVWNNGNVVRMNLFELSETFARLGLSNIWERMEEVYKGKCKHVYRSPEKPNRHTHCNSKVSYWAMGFPTVGEYFRNITKEQQEEYKKIHTHCCGIWNGVLVKSQ